MENELAHYGLLGMRWGVRRFRNYDGTLTDAGKDRYNQNGPSTGEQLRNHIRRSSGSRTSETLSKARKEDINKLSNEQLKKYNERLNLEQNYANLTKGNIGKGKEWITKTFFTGVVVGVTTQIAKDVLKKVVWPWLKATFGWNIIG